MDAVFLKVLNMSITASYVILAVLLVRLCIRLLFPEAPKKYLYWLWIVVAFRLACPWSLDSRWSLCGWALFDMSQVQQVGSAELKYIPSDITTSGDAQVSVGIPAVNEALQQAGQAVVQWASKGASENTVTAAGSEFANPLRVMSGTVLWGVGMMVLTGCGVISYLRLKWRMEKAILLKDNVYQSETVRTPFILGFFQPRIYIPFYLKDEDLCYVLDHEQTHLRRRDHLIKPLASLLLAIHWFNPLVWVAFAGMTSDMELSCDEVVLSQGENIRKAYSETLLWLSVHHKSFVYSPLAFGETSVKIRIKNALRWQAPKLATTIGTGIACILAVILCAANPLKPTPQEDIVGKYYANPDNALDSVIYYIGDDGLGINMILYITPEGELLFERRSLVEQDPVEWINAGMLKEIQLTKDNFNDYFYYNGGSRPGNWLSHDDNPLTVTSASYFRRNNWRAWRTIVENRMYYLLQQRDGQIYLAYGYYDSEGETDPFSDDSEIYYFRRLSERTSEEMTSWGVTVIEDYGLENVQPWDPMAEIQQAR